MEHGRSMARNAAVGGNGATLRTYPHGAGLHARLLTTGRRQHIYVHTMVKQTGDLVRVSMNFPRELWRRIKIAAAERDTTATDLVMQLCRVRCGQRKPKRE